ncbi:peptidase M19 renal dipeptidase (plasmid) [Gemmatirosa kalamazoonensis]|uniref:Peptidase M19 renal dipeptidase n=1 Tax=Gemmatirosa kalamazoonensis TaxID=861299 RepID=W0RVL9_9BACT|nr:membrane dipeptidase [Gemmatirosa kalamazoonensis]AHG93628.1 peptidase M19 renal dipeptidase [Gemmatirosa kalamazoonensis]
MENVDRRTAIKGALGAAAAAFAAPMINRGRYRLFAEPAPEYSARAVALMQRSLVMDMLSVFTLNFPLGDQWQARPETFGPDVIAKFKSSGINVFHPAVGIGGPDAFDQGMQFFAGWNSFLAGRDDVLMRIDSPGDFARVKSSGKIAVILGLQNAEHFRRPSDVDLFYGYGQRIAQLTYNSRNRIGNGSTERRDEGLSDFGLAIVDRMNKVCMAVDVSHCGDRTTLDAFEVSKKPVLITHSNVRALANGHPRDKSDEAIRAVGKAGSVMGITGVRMFVKDREPTTIEDALDHFDYVAKMIGPEHLGVGSDIDLDGYDDMPPELNKQLRASYKGSYGFRERIDIEGLDHPKRMFDLTEGLIRRKYTDAQIEGILGGNFRRVLSEIWSV